jgi:hypothetical protein
MTMGFLVYTQFNHKKDTNFRTDQNNSEGYLSRFSESMKFHLQQNTYVFSIAEKSYDLGLSIRFNSVTLDMESGINKHNYSKTDFTQRQTMTQNFAYKFDYNYLDLNVVKNFTLNENYRASIGIKSPAILLMGRGTLNSTFLSNFGATTNDLYYSYADGSYDIKVRELRLGLQSRIGLAYITPSFNWEINLEIKEGLNSVRTQSDDTSESFTWASASDSTSTYDNEFYTDNGANADRATTSVSIGFENILDDKNSIVYGLQYMPTSNRDVSGYDVYTLMITLINFAPGILIVSTFS